MAKMLMSDFDGVKTIRIDSKSCRPRTANSLGRLIASNGCRIRAANRIGLSKTRYHIPEEQIPIAHHILHGRYTCIARKPKCEECGLKPWCKYFLS